MVNTGHNWAGRLGLWLLWGAALLTLLTGWDYFKGIATFEGKDMIRFYILRGSGNGLEKHLSQ